MSESLGSRLRAARIRAGLTLEQASRAVPVTRQTLSRWELGQHRIPALALATLAATYLADLASLVTEPGAVPAGASE